MGHGILQTEKYLDDIYVCGTLDGGERTVWYSYLRSKRSLYFRQQRYILVFVTRCFVVLKGRYWFHVFFTQSRVSTSAES